MKRANVAAGIVVLGIASFFIWGTAGLPMGGVHAPGSGFVPFWEGTVLGLAALALVVAGVRQGSQEKVEWPREDSSRMIIHLSAALIGYVLLVDLLGYITSTFLFMVAAGSAWRRYSWRILGVSAAGFSILLFLLFDALLRMSLPRNPFGLP